MAIPSRQGSHCFTKAPYNLSEPYMTTRSLSRFFSVASPANLLELLFSIIQLTTHDLRLLAYT
jgi:hypothetical protein